MPGARLQHRHQRQHAHRRNSRPVYRRHRPEQADRFLQDDAITPKMADSCRLMLQRPHGIRGGEHRRAVRDPIRRGQRRAFELLLQMPPLDTPDAARRQ